MKSMYTTDEIAKLFNVDPSTVLKWFNSGALRGYRIPGTQNRRTAREYLVQFCKQHGINLPEPLIGPERSSLLTGRRPESEVQRGIGESTMKSMTLAQKLNQKFADDPILSEFDALYETSISSHRFINQDDLRQHLVEGALLNVGVLASKALSIPRGDYMVWMTDAGHTMLVPVSENQKPREVFEHSNDQYDIFTNTLLQNWKKLERTLSEDDEGENEEKEEKEEKSKNEILTHINVDTVDRMPILRAMQDRGHTVTSLANEVGVDPPAISRILRTPKDVQGDPKGRNPSMGMASQICAELRLDPTAAFPDIFGSSSRYEPRKTPGNRGSGMSGAASGSKRKGRGTEKYTQGNTSEGFTRRSDTLSESMIEAAKRDIDELEDELEMESDAIASTTSEEFAQRFDVLCEAIALSGLPFNTYWESYARPTLTEGNCRTVDELLNEFWWPFGSNQSSPAAKTAPKTTPKTTAPPLDPQSAAANKLYADRLAARKQAGIKPGLIPGHELRADRFEAQKQAMNERIVAPIKKAFASAMNLFLRQMQELQYNKNIGDKDAPHAWKLAQNFYNAMMQRAAEFQPNWRRMKPGETLGYRGAYDQARGAYQSNELPRNWRLKQG